MPKSNKNNVKRDIKSSKIPKIPFIGDLVKAPNVGLYEPIISVINYKEVTI